MSLMSNALLAIAALLGDLSRDPAPTSLDTQAQVATLCTALAPGAPPLLAPAGGAPPDALPSRARAGEGAFQVMSVRDGPRPLADGKAAGGAGVDRHAGDRAKLLRGDLESARADVVTLIAAPD